MTADLSGVKRMATVRELVGAEVLVVDHDAAVQRGMISLLSEADLNVTCATTPEDALGMLEKRFFSVAVVDLDTPTPGGGLRTTAAIKRRSPTTMVLILTPRKSFDDAVAAIRGQVGRDRVVLGLSGGVDSSVAAALIHRAIGDQLTCVFVDHGLLRLNEAEQVMKTFADNLGVKVIHVDASETFLGKLAGISDPEAKRKVIGAEFVAVFQQEAGKLTDARWLAQGTIYPDVIESAGGKTKKAKTIKSHHNVGGLPETLHLKLLEPLRDLFKDEVRELGVALGLPREMVYRHPFPGPGLGVRILGEVKREYADLLRRADAIFIEELRGTVATKADVAAGLVSEEDVGKAWYDLTSQAFAVFLPVRSVGVMGDGRTYEYVTALRAVQTQDFMTAHWAMLPHTLLARMSNRIINEVRGINRVVYDISGKPPATIEWE